MSDEWECSLSLLSFNFTLWVSNCNVATTKLQVADFHWGILLHIAPRFGSHSWWKADFVIQIISFESSHLPQVIIWLLASSFKNPSAVMLTNSSWLRCSKWCGDVLWHLLFCWTLYILLPHLLTDLQSPALSFFFLKPTCTCRTSAPLPWHSTSAWLHFPV